MSWKNRRRLRASGIMESSLPLPPVRCGPGRAWGSVRKVPPLACKTPPCHLKLVATRRINELVSCGRIHLATPPILDVPIWPAVAPLQEFVLGVDNRSNDDDRSDGEGSSGEGGGLGEAPGEFRDIADCTVGVNIDFGIEIPSSPESSFISVTDAKANRYPFLECI